MELECLGFKRFCFFCCCCYHWDSKAPESELVFKETLPLGVDLKSENAFTEVRSYRKTEEWPRAQGWGTWAGFESGVEAVHT